VVCVGVQAVSLRSQCPGLEFTNGETSRGYPLRLEGMGQIADKIDKLNKRLGIEVAKVG
jgi:hypothetical protein